MPLIIPKTLPAYDALYEENVFVMHRERAGQITPEDQKRVDQALDVSLGLTSY